MGLAHSPPGKKAGQPFIARAGVNFEVSQLIQERHDAAAFSPVSGFTVGEFRDWLLDYATDGESLSALAPGLTPEMVAAVSKIMGNQDLILVAKKIRVVTKFRNTIGLSGRLSVRLQPNHPTDDPKGIAASILDGYPPAGPAAGTGGAQIVYLAIRLPPARPERRRTQGRCPHSRHVVC